MRLRKTLALTALVAWLVVAFTTAALADSEATVEGRGWLAARGTGTITLDMGGWIKMKVEGDVTINDFGGDLEVRLASSSRGLSEADADRGSEVVLEDFDGYLAARGSHFLMRAEGTVKFKANGFGFAYLAGDGIYKTRNGRVQTWDTAGERLELAG